MPSAYHLAFAAQNLVLGALALLMLRGFATPQAAQVSAARIVVRSASYRRGILVLTAGVLVALSNAFFAPPIEVFFWTNLAAYLAYYAGILLMLQGMGRLGGGRRAWASD